MPCCAPVTNATFPAKRIDRLLSATPGYCVGLITPASLAAIVAVRSTGRGQSRYAVPPPVSRGALCRCEARTTLGKQTTRHVVAEFTPIRLDIESAKLYHLDLRGWHRRV